MGSVTGGYWKTLGLSQVHLRQIVDLSLRLDLSPNHLLAPSLLHFLSLLPWSFPTCSFFLSLLFSSFFFNVYLFIFRCSGSLLLCSGFSLIGESRGYSLVVVHRLLIVVGSLVAEHMLSTLSLTQNMFSRVCGLQ